MRAVGIDFGTTNSAAAVWGSDGAEVLSIATPDADWVALGFDRVLPSVVALDDDRRLVFGWQAKQLHTDRKFEAIKRLFAGEEFATAGGEQFYVEEVAAALFRHIRQSILDCGVDATSAVITIPANSRGLARYRTKVCAGMGGIEPIALVNEPTAAAMAYSRKQSVEEQMILVCDLGGGTTDVTLLEARDGIFFEQASAGVPRLGGIDFDNAVYRHIRSEVSNAASWTDSDKKRILLEIEKAKIQLSGSGIDETVISDPVLPGFRLTRPKFNELTRPFVDRAAAAVGQVLQDMKMKPSDIEVLLLVGATSKVPAVRHVLSELIGREPVTGVDPLTAVVEGAAIAAAILTGELQDADFFVSTEHALGTVTLDPQAQRLVFSPIIHRNQKLPARQQKTFVPVADYQEEVQVVVMEGDPNLPIEHPHNQVLTEFPVFLDPPRPMEEVAIQVTYEYDTDGILSVEVEDANTGEPLARPVLVSFKGARDPRELVSMAGRVRSSVDEAAPLQASAAMPAAQSQDPRTRELVNRARSKVIPFLDTEEAGALTETVNRLVTATGSAVESAQHELEEALRKYSYLL